jgi:hypothetical protein
MNRHERRAAEARARAAQKDKGFDEYKAEARRASPGISDRELGEAWMHGQAFTASGAEAVIIHELDQAPQRPTDNDWQISLAYEALSFKAFIPVALFDRGIADVEKHIVPVLRSHGAKDMRASARQWLLDMLIENRGKTDGTIAAIMAATVGWLVKTSDIGGTLIEASSPVRSIHYDITTFEHAGRRALNFRLVLGHDHNSEIPDWIKTMPPTSVPGEPPKEVIISTDNPDKDRGEEE